ncbi:MAG: hypothetical protein IJV70_07420 [Clostridia bacterium]|nr:hypothetical protein [Clostridia bacterium]
MIIKAIYDEDLNRLLKEIGSVSTERASYVETIRNLPKDIADQIENRDPSLWWVSFRPIHDETLLGPFETRSEALKAESDYLRQWMKVS